MSLPQPTHFINSILTQISHLTTPTPTSVPASADEQDVLGTQTQTQQQRPRPGHTQKQSAFPSSQLTNLKPLMLTLHCIFPNEFLLALDILDRGLVRRVRMEGGNEGDQDGLEEEFGETQIDTSPTTSRTEDFFFVTSASTVPSISSSKLKPTSSRSLYPASQAGGPNQDQFKNEIQNRKEKSWQEKGYEVRLQAWNCTCPSFTISAFRDLGPEPLPSSPPSSVTSSSSPSSHRHGQTGKIGDHHAHSNNSAQGDPKTADADASKSNTNSKVPAYSFGGTLSLHAESAPPVCKHILACVLAALCPGLGSGDPGNGNGEGEGGMKDIFVTLDSEVVAALCAGWGG
ncbi:hypothetical protein BDV06DRAFT_195443 [Aspergillus oleicola]